MTSQKQIAANRKNAKKAGVRTAAGKAISRLNAFRHGLAEEVLINTDYFQEDKALYERIKKQLFEEMQPKGAFEEMLLNQICDYYWRLRRVSRAERAAIERKLTETYMTNELERMQKVELYDRSVANKDRRTFRISLVYREMWRMAQLINTHIEGSGLPMPKQIAAILEEDFSFGHRFPQIDLILLVNHRAAVLEEEFRELLDDDSEDADEEEQSSTTSAEDTEGAVLEAARAKQRELFAEKIKVEVQLAKQNLAQLIEILECRHSVWMNLERDHDQQMSLARIIPQEKDAELIQRYEAHLHRMFMHNLHEFQRMQSSRLGRPAPMSAALDVNLNTENGFVP